MIVRTSIDNTPVEIRLARAREDHVVWVAESEEWTLEGGITAVYEELDDPELVAELEEMIRYVLDAREDRATGGCA